MSFADAVAKAADSDRRALGFLPRSRYHASCEQGRVFVAVTREGHSVPVYAGHVMFGGAASELHIQQLYVDQRCRKRGAAKLLVDAVVAWAESRNYLGIAIRVAADLKASNHAWERLGFSLVRQVKGRGSSKRRINLRHRELRSQSLLQFVRAVGRTDITFSVPPNVGRGVPTYVVDLNVYFDCLKDRGRRPATQALFRAAFSTLFRLVTTREFPRELERHASADVGKADPILELARALPVLPYAPTSEDQELATTLAKRFFPDRSAKGSLTERDKSDVAHLVIAIRSRAAGFVTSERVLLLQRDWVRATLGTDIVPVEEIVDYLRDAEPSAQGRTASAAQAPTFQVCDRNERDLPELTALCDRTKTPTSLTQRVVAWSKRDSAQRLIVAKVGHAIVAALGWRLVNGPPRQVEGILIADSESDAAPAAVDYLIETMIHAASTPSIARIDLQGSELHDPLQQALLDHGFTKDAANGWTKIAVGRHVDSVRWSRVAQDIEALCGLVLPKALMSERFAYARTIHCTMDDGRSWFGSLDDLEGLLSPIILTFSDRPATVVPIRAAFAEGLFGHLEQVNLFGQPIASFRRERVYYTSSRSFALFDRGHILLFYESSPGNGRAAVIAAARALGARTILKSELQPATLVRGVLDKTEIKNLGAQSTVTAVSFDNVIMLPKPVTIEQMRAHNWVPGTNFVTATPLQGDVARQILDLGHQT